MVRKRTTKLKGMLWKNLIVITLCSVVQMFCCNSFVWAEETSLNDVANDVALANAESDASDANDESDADEVEPDMFTPYPSFTYMAPITASTAAPNPDYIVIRTRGASLDVMKSRLNNVGVSGDMLSLSKDSGFVTLSETNISVNPQDTSNVPYMQIGEKGTVDMKDVKDFADKIDVNNGMFLPVTYEIVPKDEKGNVVGDALPINFTTYRLLRKISEDEYQIALYSPLTGNGLQPVAGKDLNAKLKNGPLYPGYNLNMERDTYWKDKDGNISFVGGSYGIPMEDLEDAYVEEPTELLKKGIVVTGKSNYIVAGRSANAGGLVFFGNYTIDEIADVYSPKFTAYLNAKPFKDSSDIVLKQLDDNMLKIKSSDDILNKVKEQLKTVTNIDGKDA